MLLFTQDGCLHGRPLTKNRPSLGLNVAAIWFQCLLSLCLFFLPALRPKAIAQEANALPLAGDQIRVAHSDIELRNWLENMVWYHRFSPIEISAVTGLDEQAIEGKLAELNISHANRPARDANKLLVLPYPGGRHPRAGFLDGAIAPQRETKLSVFCPWDDNSYAVIDVPEAIWSNLGLTYLAHTHIDTIWTVQRTRLEQLEWIQQGDTYSLTRILPNKLEFGVKVSPFQSHLRMSMWLTNGTSEPLSDLRVQNCVMLGAMRSFDQQSNENKLFLNGYATAHNPAKDRWVVTAWDPVNRTWGNRDCPCLHSDPKFPDCAPGETKWLRGWFSFYEGNDIESELARIEQTGWRLP